MLRTGVIRHTKFGSRSTSTTTSSTRLKTRGRLPVPPLRQTLDRYLTSLEPFLLEDELRGGMSYSSAHALREKWASEFESGIGHILQERLVALDKVSPDNWLDDNFWINKAYLEWRAPLLVNSNWWLAFCDDTLIPKSALSGETNNNRAGTTFWQLRRSAWLIYRMLQFKENVAQEEGTPDTVTPGSWLLENTSKMFNIGRIPEILCDTISEVPNPHSKHARSIHLMIHDWCYSVVVYRSPTSTDPHAPLELLSPGEIETRLRAVVLDVEARLANGEKALPVGVLSADERDRWAHNLSQLLLFSPENRKSHQAMLHSVMGVSLDHTTYSIPPITLPSDVSPTQVRIRSAVQSAIDSHLHSIRGTAQNISNRFFDKPFTLIVDPSTRAGASGEHSPVDALVPSIVAEYGLVQGLGVDAFNHTGSEVGNADGEGWQRLDWVGDEKIWKECNMAYNRAISILNNSDDSVLWYEKYGTEWIKSIGGYKLSPDAFIQMALQLAWYKTRGEFTATYETVLTRMFKRGRTETLRTYSCESRLWVLSMVDPKSTPQERFELLRQAISSHTRRTREAMTGRGFDRHLLGLRLLLRPLSGESAPLLEDELFERSTQWKLSTSGLSAGLLFKGTGFGASYDDGYGINYLAAPNGVKFGIESKFQNPLTSTQIFQDAVVAAMEDMHSLCEIATRDRADRLSHL
ncbi:acyltransferase ChoActase/COT/CPT [Pholiota conissans]|uniref:Acyltransferase ChoActase/COT/CPT n=1 Tax=Pholiota conissans TaxID=109636 RepID=A0A9P5ZBR0_9AGAR|nr:acyltransferase ChoActase/COT/CPT [Pholiota conissans]